MLCERKLTDEQQDLLCLIQLFQILANKALIENFLTCEPLTALEAMKKIAIESQFYNYRTPALEAKQDSSFADILEKQIQNKQALYAKYKLKEPDYLALLSQFLKPGQKANVIAFLKELSVSELEQIQEQRLQPENACFYKSYEEKVGSGFYSTSFKDEFEKQFALRSKIENNLRAQIVKITQAHRDRRKHDISNVVSSFYQERDDFNSSNLQRNIFNVITTLTITDEIIAVMVTRFQHWPDLLVKISSDIMQLKVDPDTNLFNVKRKYWNIQKTDGLQAANHYLRNQLLTGYLLRPEQKTIQINDSSSGLQNTLFLTKLKLGLLERSMVVWNRNLNDVYVQSLFANVINVIEAEYNRLRMDRGSLFRSDGNQKAATLYRALSELAEPMAEYVIKPQPTVDDQQQLHNEVLQIMLKYANNEHRRNPLADFFRGLVGVIISLGSMFTLPACSTKFNDLFFKSQTRVNANNALTWLKSYNVGNRPR